MLKRKFYSEHIDSSFNIHLVLKESDREQFVERSKYQVHLYSLHSQGFVSVVRTIFYLIFVLILPLNQKMALYAYFAAIGINALMIRQKHTNLL
jgi:hypothetical protein